MDWKEALKNRVRRAADNREARNLGGSRQTALDLSKINLPEWTPKTGREKNAIDIMPYRVTQSWYPTLRTRAGECTNLEVGMRDYKLEYPVHKIRAGRFLCPREAFGRANDSICEEMFAEWGKRKVPGSNFNEKKARDLQTSWRNAYIIYDYYDAEKGFQLWNMAYANFEKYLLEQIYQEMKIFWDLAEGFTLEFKMREEAVAGSDKATYKELHGDIEFVNRDPYKEDVLDQIPSLDAALIISSYEDIHEAYFGGKEETASCAAPVSEERKSSPSEVRSRGRSTESEKEKVEEPPSRSRGRSEGPPPDAPPFDKDGEWGQCPAGGTFGKDCNQIQACKDEACNQKVYEACLKASQGKRELAQDTGTSEVKSESRIRSKPEEMKTTETSSGRTRRR